VAVPDTCDFEMLVDNLASPKTESLHATLSERELQRSHRKRPFDSTMLSLKTVYRARLLELKLSNNAELAVYAIRNELV
jgi:hypothetical protein